MKLLSEAKLRQLQAEFPTGTRIELVSMDDPQAPPVGTKGTVRLVDAIGSLVVDWDNGSGLNVVYGEDVVKKLDTVTVITYGQKQIWDSRAEAIAFYLEGGHDELRGSRARPLHQHLPRPHQRSVCM